jgi:AGZA family xanthine/uracil permease-like MFS transporter
MEFIERYFGVRAAGSTVQREIVGGLTSFATMSYIVFVQPTVLAMAGMDFGGVLVATCLSSAAACIIMGLLARYPFALAPGMGENFLFVFTVCMGMGFAWQSALGIVFISGLLFLALSLFQIRERVLDVFPDCLKHSIGPAIGLFIAFIGLQWGGIVVLNSATMVAMGDMRHGAPLLTLFGVLLITTLMARNLRGAILTGIVATTVLGLLTGVLSAKTQSVTPNFSTFFQLRFDELLHKPLQAGTAIMLFFFLVLFDTVGTLVGVSTQAGFIDDKGRLPRAGRAFVSDALATTIGALFGTSTVTSYVESAAGVAAGARTGLAAVVTGICFVLAIGLAPIAAIVGQDIGPAYYAALGVKGALVPMHPAVAPALIVVGLLMLAPLRKVQWEDVTESLPAFLTVAMMAFGYGITEGVAAGCISFVAVKLTSGRGREAHPVMYIVAVALALRYAFLR